MNHLHNYFNTYGFKSDFFKEKWARAIAEATARGEARTEAHGWARAILIVLSERGITVPDAIQATIVATTDIERLERWHRRAVTVATAEDVLHDE